MVVFVFSWIEDAFYPDNARGTEVGRHINIMNLRPDGDEISATQPYSLGMDISRDFSR